MLSGFPPQRRYRNDGAHMVGQMYAQHFRLAQPRYPIPIALWHGGGLTGASWETTPDGRAGWSGQSGERPHLDEQQSCEEFIVPCSGLASSAY